MGSSPTVLVLRAPGLAEIDRRAAAGRVRETTARRLAHQDLPFERLVAALQPDRHLAHNPLFEVVFALQNAPARCTAGRPACARWRSGNGLPTFDLNWGWRGWRQAPGDDRVQLRDLAGGDRSERLRPLRGAALRDGGATGRAAVEPVDAHRRRADRFSPSGTTPRRPTPGTGLDELFAARGPGAGGAAVAFGGDRLTYGELERSAALACRLGALGVGSRGPVGIWSSGRSPWWSSMLAILPRAGASCRSNSQPRRARLAFMLADAGAKVVLAHARRGSGAAVTGPTRRPAAARYRGG